MAAAPGGYDAGGVGYGFRNHISAWFYGYKKGSRNDYGRPMKRSLDRSIGVSPPPDLDEQIRLINDDERYFRINTRLQEGK